MVDSYEDWPERRSSRRESRPEGRPDGRVDGRLEQRLDQWVSAGRQLVDGVSGARPGSRGPGRGSSLRLDQVGRWVEDKIDWLLEDEEGWRESWEDAPPAGRRAAEQPSQSRRRPLDAISRRGQRAPMRQSPLASAPETSAEDNSWPDDDSFSVNRWRRGEERPAPGAPASQPLDAAPGRALPRSTRRRSL